MPWYIDIDALRRLIAGTDASDLPDPDLIADVILIPVIQQIKHRCPGIIDTTDPEVQAVIKVVVARLLASGFIGQEQRITGSRLGDSSISIHAGDVDARADAMARSAWALLDTVCGSSGGTGIGFTLAGAGRGCVR